MLLLGTGCAASNDARIKRTYAAAGQTDELVRSFELVGIESIDEEELREGLFTKPDPGWRADAGWMPLIGAERSYYNSIEFERDLQRIRIYYRARGYYDAKISSRINNRTRDGNRAIRLTISEGKPSVVTRIRFEGLERSLPERDAIVADLPMKEGDVFTERGWSLLKARVAERMRQRSFAYAEVTGLAVVRPSKRSAELTLYVDPGPRARIGEVTIEGLPDNVDEDYVRDAITFAKGDSYTSSALQKTQDAIYALGVFGLVNVQPAFNVRVERAPKARDPETVVLEEDAGGGDLPDLGPLGISRLVEAARERAVERSTLDTTVPIIIQLKAAKNWSARVGAGFSLDSTRQDVHVIANASSRNFFNTLGKFENTNTLGYAWTPGLGSLFDESGEINLGNNGVIFSSTLGYEQPQFLERKLRGFLNVAVARDVQETFISLEPTGSIGLRRPFFDLLTAQVSYATTFVFYQDVDDGFRDELRDLGLDADAETPSQLLEFLELSATIDKRDNPLDPTQGFRVELGIQRAGSYLLGGESTFVRPRISLEGYLPYTLGIPMITAARARITSIYNLNASDSGIGIPISSRVLAGGRSSMRSFGTRYFGSFTDDETDPGPIGTITVVESSVEQRFRVARRVFGFGDVWLAGFLDAGTFSEAQLGLDSGANTAGTVRISELTSELILGSGFGAWWVTPIGPVRVDFAWTLSDLASDPRFSREAVRSKVEPDLLFGLDNIFIGIGHSF